MTQESTADDPPDFELTAPVYSEALHTHLSINQLSLLTGMDRATITKRLKETPWRPGAKQAKLYDTTVALPLIYNVGVSGETLEHLNPQREKALLDRERRRIAELDRQHKEGRLVDTVTVREEWLAIVSIARSRLLSMPARIAPDLASESDSRRVEDHLRAAIHDVLDEMSSDVHQLGAENDV